jgi:type VI secretion system secreted protein Hcp
MAIYMKYGDTIKGRTTTQGFAGWMELGSLQFGAGRGIGSAKGKGTNREASEPSLSEITVTREWDAEASAALFQESVMGSLDTKVTIKMTSTNKGVVETFLEINLEETGISGYSVSSGGDKPSESLSLNYGKIEFVPYKQEEDMSMTKGTPVNYSLVLMKANA